MKEIKCNLCGSNHHVVVFKSLSKDKKETDYSYSITEEIIPPEKIMQCVSCGLVFVPPGDNAEKILSRYIEMIDEKYLSEEKGRRKTAVSVLKKLRRHKTQGNKLLDIGCSAGFFLDEAKHEGWEVEGVDPSRWAADYAKEKYGIKVHNTILKNAELPSNYFDLVVLEDTIEHTINPREMLIEIRRILKPNGLVYINTPDIDSIASRILRAKWWGINRHHLYYFSKHTLNKLLEAAGFKSIRWSLYARNFSFDYWLNRIKPHNPVLYKLLMLTGKIGGLKNRLIRINLRDQIEVFAVKRRSLKYLSELEDSGAVDQQSKKRTTVVLPAYNAAHTLKATFNDIPKDIVNEIILVDDASTDNTVEIAEKLGIYVFKHDKNKGYGANQKTCYKIALEHNSDIIVMVHPDYQYDPRVIPDLIDPIKKGKADVVFGSRMLKGGALIGGMPLWKHNVNIMLSALANVVLKTYLTEYHSGFRAYSAEFLKTIRFERNSDNFVFDFEIIVQAITNYCKIEEIPIRTRYFDEASTIKFWPSFIYGGGILKTLVKFMLHDSGLIKFKQFE